MTQTTNTKGQEGKKRGGKTAAQPALVQKEYGHVRRGKTIACSENAMASVCIAGVSGEDAPTDVVASKPRRLPAPKAAPKKRERVIAALPGDEQEEFGRGKKTNIHKQQQHLDPEVDETPAKRKRGRPKKSQTPSPTEVPRVPSLEMAKENDETPSRTQGNFPEEPLWTPPKRRRLCGKQRPTMPSKPMLGDSLLEKQQQDAVQNGGKAGAEKASEQQCTVEAISCEATAAAIESGESVMSPLEIFRSLLA